jgi:hypothetical protein
MVAWWDGCLCIEAQISWRSHSGVVEIPVPRFRNDQTPGGLQSNRMHVSHKYDTLTQIHVAASAACSRYARVRNAWRYSHQWLRAADLTIPVDPFRPHLPVSQSRICLSVIYKYIMNLGQLSATLRTDSAPGPASRGCGRYRQSPIHCALSRSRDTGIDETLAPV